ncbi:helix-turn-helix domain-containing protein [Kibdelosporangium aridum]|uniref:AraC-like ligand binding domain-containing protein n=1 Tax=Kibdelosporangium aridum TaxID=2030 RepID=A0A1Y5X844_KIBAR|nr:helix-turn-helix domain-containing protein [Kibdelosporangium aridum]SMC74443.1 AraC-like ligand binding domain-containing protein [Kibdelosporangium aridum]
MRGTTVPPGTPCLAPRNGEPPIHRLEVADAMPFAMGTFDSIGPLSRAPFPHRHTFHEIVYVTGGTGTHVVDLARWQLRPPHLCVIVPGQVHHWENAQDLDGFVTLFTDDFLVDHPADRELLRRLSERPWLSLDKASHDRMQTLIAELHQEFQDGTESVLRALLHVIVSRAARLTEVPGPSPARAHAVAQKFAALTAQTDLWTVREYADQIGVTPGYLTDVVKNAIGRTPSQLIREARIREAKRLLIRTDLTVRQISRRIGFADSAYFCRFFRRETGDSPGDFREKHHDWPHQSIVSEQPPT